MTDNAELIALRDKFLDRLEAKLLEYAGHSGNKTWGQAAGAIKELRAEITQLRRDEEK